MFTPDNNDSICALGEVRLIAQIRQWLGDVSPPAPKGMGDDCALIDPPSGKQILTTDTLTYGHHFDDSVTPKNAGNKLVKRNLSDIAAMGGTPDYGLLTLLSGADLRLDWLEAFIRGIRESCQLYRVSLVGGDVSSLPAGQFSAALSLTGHLEQAPLLRRGAQEGDALYVTSELGGSILGKHYNFEPRLREAQWLARSSLCSACMDLTDGLAKDLRELIPTACAAHIELDRIPLSEAAHKCAAQSGRPPLEHAFCDGEDYELLFAVKGAANFPNFETSWQAHFPGTALTRIGWLRAKRSSQAEASYLDAETKEALPWVKGFEHLGRND